MNLLYFINLLPIFLYVPYIIFILLNKLNLYLSDILYIGIYLIIIMSFLLHVENIPNKYNVIYNKMINVKIIEKNGNYYLSEDSFEYFKNEILFKI